MRPAILVFTDVATGHEWTHTRGDWILTYCNFNSEIHPNCLKIGQSIVVKDIHGGAVTIECKKFEDQTLEALEKSLPLLRSYDSEPWTTALRLVEKAINKAKGIK